MELISMPTIPVSPIQNTEREESPSLSTLSTTNSKHPLFFIVTFPSFYDVLTRHDTSSGDLTHNSGDRIPYVKYTDEENATWGVVYKKLTSLYPTHACKQQNYVLPLLEQNCGYGPNGIPQLEDVSRYLQGEISWKFHCILVHSIFCTKSSVL